MISQYVVEKREATRKSWQIATVATYRTSAKVDGLTEGASYLFRVMAENEYGLGAPCETKQVVRISEVPGTPESIAVTNVTDTTATVSWTKPGHDGGNQITGYVVEMSQKGGFEAWKVAGTTKSTRYVVSKLPTGKDYLFRVRAQVSG